MSGYVKISRTLWDDEAFRDAPFSEREAWIWMIAEAAWKERKKRVGDIIVSLDRGQLAASTRFLAGAWQWSHAKVRRFLERVSKLDMIRLETGTGVTIITICKYNNYQDGGTATGTGPAQTRRREEGKKGRIRERTLTSPCRQSPTFSVIHPAPRSPPTRTLQPSRPTTPPPSGRDGHGSRR